MLLIVSHSHLLLYSEYK